MVEIRNVALKGALDRTQNALVAPLQGFVILLDFPRAALASRCSAKLALGYHSAPFQGESRSNDRSRTCRAAG